MLYIILEPLFSPFCKKLYLASMQVTDSFIAVLVTLAA